MARRRKAKETDLGISPVAGLAPSKECAQALRRREAKRRQGYQIDNTPAHLGFVVLGIIAVLVVLCLVEPVVKYVGQKLGKGSGLVPELVVVRRVGVEVPERALGRRDEAERRRRGGLDARGRRVQL